MTFEEYQKQALTTLLSDQEFGEFNAQFIAQVLGLVGESGEFADKIKKRIRNDAGRVTPEERTELLKELGDVLWYVNSLSHLLGSSIAEVAQMNMDKLNGRKSRGVIKGAGDNR
ncbi:MAG TPA: nucleoside triphosphate pyrophosphohydrolase family protein [Candidatus Saccharimonadales bacterium]